MTSRPQPPGSEDRPTLVLDFDLNDFASALAVYDESASGLWPEREPGRRAVQLMLVHVSEDLDTRRSQSTPRLTFGSDGYVKLLN